MNKNKLKKQIQKSLHYFQISKDQFFCKKNKNHKSESHKNKMEAKRIIMYWLKMEYDLKWIEIAPLLCCTPQNVRQQFKYDIDQNKYNELLNFLNE